MSSESGVESLNSYHSESTKGSSESQRVASETSYQIVSEWGRESEGGILLLHN